MTAFVVETPQHTIPLRGYISVFHVIECNLWPNDLNSMVFFSSSSLLFRCNVRCRRRRRSTCESSRLCRFLHNLLQHLCVQLLFVYFVFTLCQCSYCQLSSFCCPLCINASLIVNYILSPNAIAAIAPKLNKTIKSHKEWHN